MKKKLVLIVDDEKDLRKIIRYNLEQEGIASIEASDGSQAIDLLSKNPSLIILDIMMPGQSGLDFTSENKKKLILQLFYSLQKERQVRGLKV